MFARSIAERLCRDTCFWRRLPKELGRRPILVSPDAALRFLKPGRAGIDMALLETLADHARPGMSVWDIGASVGEFTIAAAHLTGGSVLAIEADPFIFGLLACSLAANAELDVKLLRTAVADQAGWAMFRVSASSRNRSGLARTMSRHVDARREMEVSTVTLDSLLETAPTPGLVKMDIEGAELAALRGARTLIEEVRPIWIVEVSPSSEAEARRVFTEAGYEVSGEGDLIARSLAHWRPSASFYAGA